VRPKTALLVAIVLVVAAMGGAYYWLFYDNRMPSYGTFPLDIGAIRAEAASIRGPRATSIQVETLSHTLVPKIAMIAGTTWTKIDTVRESYRVVFPDQSIIIDTGYDATTAKASRADSFDPAAWKRMLVAMREASKIVVTHEHADHIGGLLTSPDWATLLPKAVINEAQFDDTDRTLPVIWPGGSRAHFKPVSYDRLLAIAPGVVLIRAPGHTPGSQMIYVQRADGQEYLFMGDVASEADNVRLLRIRSRLVTDFMTHDDRNAVMLETRALHDLATADPRIVLVPGHDSAAITAFENEGVLVHGFTE
jgi:glyoxylase-like metal-dependent hydrolase (beta-lactamase superfamily II)